MAGVARWQVLVGLLCVALAVFAGTLSVAHGHEQGGPVHADCGFCVTAHGSVQAAAPVALGPVVGVVAKLEVAVPLVRPRLVPGFALYIRPPPSAAHLIS